MAGYEWITFLSDYGLEDNFVGVCHGVMAKIAPHARVIDLCHAVPPQDVRHGATVLAQAMPFVPRAVHLAVVDPGVGGERAMVALDAGGHALVGPDNGLLVTAAERLGGVDRAHAHLAAGADLADLGPEVDPRRLVRLDPLLARVDGDRVHGNVLLVDHFGNVALNVSREQLERVGVALGDRVEVRIGGQAHRLPFAETFSAVPAGRLVLHEDSFSSLSVAVNQGRAAERLRVRSGDPVVVARVAAAR
jgi:S-adenosyl-L-methionine hydrolase (adenosine-forming)